MMKHGSVLGCSVLWCSVLCSVLMCTVLGAGSQDGLSVWLRAAGFAPRQPTE